MSGFSPPLYIPLRTISRPALILWLFWPSWYSDPHVVLTRTRQYTCDGYSQVTGQQSSAQIPDRYTHRLSTDISGHESHNVKIRHYRRKAIGISNRRGIMRRRCRDERRGKDLPTTQWATVRTSDREGLGAQVIYGDRTRTWRLRGLAGQSTMYLEWTI